MKKLFAIIIAIVLFVSVSGCGQLDTSTESQPSTESIPSLENNFMTEPDPAISFTELTVVDNSECTIKLVDFVKDSPFGSFFKVQFENKTVDKALMFTVDNLSVNGIQCNSLCASEVAAGKKSNTELLFDEDVLEDNNVTKYTDIEITFRVYDFNDWLADPVAIETVHVYPYGEDYAVNFVRTSAPTDIVLFDNEFVTAVVTGYEENTLYGYSVNLFLVNKTDTEVMFSVDDASMNGFMMDPFYATTLSANKCTFSSISWFEAALDDNGIVEVTELEFVIKAYDNNNLIADAFVEETVKLSP